MRRRAARPAASPFGEDAYPGLDEKAAALLHSLARNHALIDGNKRLALAGMIPFYGLNGRRLTLTNDEAYDLVMAVAEGRLDAVSDIAARLRHATEPREGAAGRFPARLASAEEDDWPKTVTEV